jgi:hypothetical protein
LNVYGVGEGAFTGTPSPLPVTKEEIQPLIDAPARYADKYPGVTDAAAGGGPLTAHPTRSPGDADARAEWLYNCINTGRTPGSARKVTVRVCVSACVRECVREIDGGSVGLRKAWKI